MAVVFSILHKLLPVVSTFVFRIHRVTQLAPLITSCFERQQEPELHKSMLLLLARAWDYKVTEIGQTYFAKRAQIPGEGAPFVADSLSSVLSNMRVTVYDRQLVP